MARVRKSPAAKKPRSRKGTAKAESVELQQDTTGGAYLLPKMEANEPFVLLYRPDRLAVVGGRVLPVLGTLPLKPGLSNVDRARNGQIQRRGAEAYKQERGWTVIPNTAGPGGSYLRKTQVKGGYHYHLWCVELLQGSDQTRTDHDAYAEWLGELVESGAVPPMMPHAVEALVERLEEMHVNALNKATVIPSKAAYAAELAKQIEAAKATLEKLDAEEAIPAASAGVSLDGTED